MESRQQKIDNLFKLIKGEINPDDLKPKRLCMAIGYTEDPIYIVNEKEVSADEYWKLAKVEAKEFGAGEAVITYNQQSPNRNEDFFTVISRVQDSQENNEG